MAGSPRRFNLNLLPLLDALLECRSVTRAGERFNLTQPAASAALAKLRDAFGDELLVAVGREMRLTPKAERIREPVRQLLNLVDTAFDSASPDPSSWSGEFIIATADYVALMLLPTLMPKLDQGAPKIKLRIASITRHSVSNLRNGEIDMIIAPPQLVDDPVLMSRRLFGDRFVVLHAKDRPPSETTLASYVNEAHVATVIDGSQLHGLQRPQFSRELDELRSTQHNLAITPYYSLLPFLVAEAKCLALVQERLAKLFMRYLPVAYSASPVEILPLHLHMLWNPRYNEDPRHVWLRNSVFDSCATYREGSP